MVEYKEISKDQQQSVYGLRNERYGSSRPVSGAVTSKEYDSLNIQVSELPKKLHDLLTIEEPYGDEYGDKKKAKLLEKIEPKLRIPVIVATCHILK